MQYFLGIKGIYMYYAPSLLEALRSVLAPVLLVISTVIQFDAAKRHFALSRGGLLH